MLALYTVIVLEPWGPEPSWREYVLLVWMIAGLGEEMRQMSELGLLGWLLSGWNLLDGAMVRDWRLVLFAVFFLLPLPYFAFCCLNFFALFFLKKKTLLCF